MEVTFWLALSAIGTFILACAAFVTVFMNIHLNRQESYRHAKSEILDEIRDWAFEIRDVETLMDSPSKLRKAEAIRRHDLLLAKSMPVLAGARHLDEEMVDKVRRTFNICVDGYLSQRLYGVKEGGEELTHKDFTASLNALLVNITNYKLSLFLPKPIPPQEKVVCEEDQPPAKTKKKNIDR